MEQKNGSLKLALNMTTYGKKQLKLNSVFSGTYTAVPPCPWSCFRTRQNEQAEKYVPDIHTPKDKKWLNKIEMRHLPEKEFKVMVIKILTRPQAEELMDSEHQQNDRKYKEPVRAEEYSN